MNSERQLLLKVDEAARVLGLGRSKTYELLASGELPAVRIGRARRIPVASLERFVERKMAATEGDAATSRMP